MSDSRWWNEKIDYGPWHDSKYISSDSLEEYQEMIDVSDDSITSNHLLSLFKHIDERNPELKEDLLKYCLDSWILKNTKTKFLFEYRQPQGLYEIKDLILELYHIRYIEESGEMLLYAKGVYNRNKQRKIKAIISKILRIIGVDYNNRTSTDLYKLIQNATLTSIKEFDKDPYILNLENGLLNIVSESFKKHTPDYLSFRRIPLIYNNEAFCPEIDNFFLEIFHKDDIPFIHEWTGLCLTPLMIYQIAVMLYGIGNNGKTTLLNLMQIFLGERNCTNIDISKMKYDSVFAQIENKLLNVVADIDSSTRINIQRFKDYVGNALLILINKKYKDPYSINPTAKIMYSCNSTFPELPKDTDKGFWRKWSFIECPNSFDKKEEANKIKELINEKELSGLLNKAIKGFQRLHNRGKFEGQYYDWELIKDFWIENKDPVNEYINEFCIEDIENYENNFVIQDNFVTQFNKYYQKKGKIPLYPGTITKKINSNPKYKQARKRINGEDTKIYRGFRFKHQVIEKNKLELLINGEIQE